ncbi:MAG: hypothetical protein ACD_29C00448G0001, partial [uncultured bacterium]
MYSVFKNIQNIIHRHFTEETLHRAFSYAEHDHVKRLTITEQGLQISALVTSANNGKEYQARVHITPHENPDKYSIESHCTCPVKSRCKHAAAALIDAVERNERTLFSNLNSFSEQKATASRETERLTQWINQLQSYTANTVTQHNQQKDDHRLHYILSYRSHNKTMLDINLSLARVLKNGGIGKPKRFDPDSFSQAKFLDEQDQHNVTYIKIMHHGASFHGSSTIMLTGKNSSRYLEEIIQTKRCHFNDVQNSPITLGKPKSLELKWEMLPSSNQKIACFIDQKPTMIFVLDQLWYFDASEHCMGIAETPIPLSLVSNLLSAPEVPVELIDTVNTQLQSLLPKQVSLSLATIMQPHVLDSIRPTPIMTLSVATITKEHPQYHFQMVSEQAPVAQIAFDYANHVTVPFSFANTQKTVKFLKNGQLHKLERHFDSEKQWLLELAKHIELSQLKQPLSLEQAEKYLIQNIHEEVDYINFIITVIPQLEMEGWKIIRNHENFNSIVNDVDVTWYSELDESSSYQYFEFKLGIMIEGEKIDVLPVIARLLKTTPADQLKQYRDDQKIVMALPNGKKLSTTFSRIKPIITVLVELFDSTLTDHATLRLSKYQAELLHELEKGLDASKHRWFGGEKLRTLGKKISEFRSIQSIKTPAIFKATLRPYQQAGLNWLQFLREYQLNGILADDMGLGKTVQTLAHLSVEKENNRIQKPVLIIAPTSLMFNWQKEIETFSPTLKTIVFHGDDRKSHQENLSQADIVLTTYPLLTRDKDILLKQNFYYLILDEAQNIKNNQTKSTQIVHQLQAEHRLCLTGTPMENHLGELWSLFHFLMPGLLGDVAQFNRLFRKPIEKENNTERKALLSRRLRPFILRRKKSEVALDLPEKTEIIRTTELAGPERDLYESIRLSMEKKVRDAIKTQGLNRSHIIILDALLKLRQVCCHPALVKLESAKKAGDCASKLELLRSMLPNMVEEGRKILIFSQFTAMLHIIEGMLTEEKLSYVMLTGDTKNRAEPIAAFQAGNVPIFLISLKAGGTG